MTANNRGTSKMTDYIVLPNSAESTQESGFAGLALPLNRDSIGALEQARQDANEAFANGAIEKVQVRLDLGAPVWAVQLSDRYSGGEIKRARILDEDIREKDIEGALLLDCDNDTTVPDFLEVQVSSDGAVTFHHQTVRNETSMLPMDRVETIALDDLVALMKGMLGK